MDCRWKRAGGHTKHLLQRVVSALQESLREELKCLQKQQIIVFMGVDEMSEWCNSFVLVPKADGRCNYTWIQPDSIKC